MPLVFLGSLVDWFFKTSDRAALEIRKRLPDRRLPAEEAPPMRKRMRRRVRRLTVTARGSLGM